MTVVHLKADQHSWMAFQRHSEDLLSSGRFSDLTIEVDIGASFRAHKSQFSLACPIHDLSHVSYLSISGVAREAVQRLLKFLYLGETETPLETVSQIRSLLLALGSWSTFKSSFSSIKLFSEETPDESESSSVRIDFFDENGILVNKERKQQESSIASSAQQLPNGDQIKQEIPFDDFDDLKNEGMFSGRD